MVITPDLTPTLEFVQTGYAMSYSVSHDVTVLVSRGLLEYFVHVYLLYIRIESNCGGACICMVIVHVYVYTCVYGTVA